MTLRVMSPDAQDSATFESRYSIPALRSPVAFHVDPATWEKHAPMSEEGKARRRLAARVLQEWRARDRVTGAPAIYDQPLRVLTKCGLGIMLILLVGLVYNIRSRSKAIEATAIPKGYLIMPEKEGNEASRHAESARSNEQLSIAEELRSSPSSREAIENAIQSRKP